MNKMIIATLVFIALIASLSAPALAHMLNASYTQDVGNTSGSAISSPMIRHTNWWFSNNYQAIPSSVPTNASPVPTPTTVSPVPTTVSPVPTPSTVSPVPTTDPINPTPAITPRPDSYTTSPGEKLRIGNLNQPVISRPNTSEKNLLNKTYSNEPRLKTAKNLADARINLVISQIEVYKKEVTNSRLSNSDKSVLFREADQNITWFKEKQSEIQSANDLDTVQGIMSAVNQQIGTLKVDLKRGAGLLACDEVDVKITTAQNVSGIIGQKINGMKAQGNDTGQAEKLLADYNGHVSAASVHMDAAKSGFNNITSTDNADRNFATGYGELSRSETELGKAYVDLKGIYRLLLRK